MHELPSGQVPDIKLDSASTLLEAALTPAQKRGMFETPGRSVVAIVTLAAVEYTGHSSTERTPRVKLRLINVMAAHTDRESTALLEAARAMYRQRTIHGTLEEVTDPAPAVEDVLQVALLDYPSEGELEEHLERERQVRVGSGGRP
jgi:hypothetical protein